MPQGYHIILFQVRSRILDAAVAQEQWDITAEVVLYITTEESTDAVRFKWPHAIDFRPKIRIFNPFNTA